MLQHIVAKPTRYRGITFRSRLEARWASFFDLTGWRWEYEPLDLAGWIPDFALIGAEHPILAEVKPIMWAGDDCSALIDQVTERDDMAKVLRLIAAQEARELNKPHLPDECPFADLTAVPEILVLGAYPHCCTKWSEPVLGVFLRSDVCGNTDLAALTGGGRSFDFCAYWGSYRHRISGKYDGSRDDADFGDVQAAWREAGSIVQWRP